MSINMDDHTDLSLGACPKDIIEPYHQKKIWINM